jgi:O-antigen ligase
MPIKMIHLSFILICLGVIIVSRNRSAQLSLFVTLPFLFLYAKAKLRYIFVPIAIIIAIAVTLKAPYMLYMLTERYQGWFTGGGIITNILTSDSVSLDLWTSAIKIFLDHPFLGIGAGMWEEVYPRYTSMPGIVVLLSGNKPHSLLLQYFAFAGLGAGLLCVLIYLYTIIKCVKRILSLKQKDLYLPVLGLSWSITALLLHEITRGYQIFNYYGYTVIGICLFFGFDNLLTKIQKPSSTQKIANQK